MKSIPFLLGIGLIGVAFASGTHIGPWVDNVQPCKIMCFDSILYKNTDGFNPQFLQQQSVKLVCQEALNDGVKLGYCDAKLGTL